MPSKNDLSGLLNQTAQAGKNSILPQKEMLPSEPQRKVGRPRKKLSEKRDYKISLSLTEEEGNTIRKKAGLAGDATFVYALLKEQKVFED